MCRHEDIADKDYLVYLYMSETYRVFRDRLIDEKDRLKFSEMSHQIMEENMIMDWQLEDFTNTIFGTFESPDKQYIKLNESTELLPRLEEQLLKYNSDSDT